MKNKIPFCKQENSYGTILYICVSWFFVLTEVPSLKSMSRGILIALALLSFTVTLKAQFIDILIDLPASSRIQSMGGESYNKKLNGQEENGRGASLQWIGISVAENLQLTVEVSYLPEADGEKAGMAAYLNNGTSNIDDAVSFDKRVVFQTNNSIQLTNKIHMRPKSFTAWIGVPPAQTRELMIEYN